PSWIDDQRRRNQSPNMRQQSATLFRRLELLVLREIERDHRKPDYLPRNFVEVVDKLNILLERVRVERDEISAFRIVNRDNNQEASANDLSSGESELISLGIEFLTFVRESISDKNNLLFVDEPDVHLHPDLQDRLAQFVMDAIRDKPVTIV